MFLRQKVASIISGPNGDAEKAAVKILLMLEDEGLALEGNGWFDGDEVMDKALEDDA